MQSFKKLKKGDQIAIVSPSFAAPGRWPHVYELALQRMRDVFQLEPVEFSATKKLGASKEERAADLIAAFANPKIKAVMASLGGDDQVTYARHLPPTPFQNNPKPFFGYSGLLSTPPNAQSISATLESASVDGNIEAFGLLMRNSMKMQPAI